MAVDGGVGWVFFTIQSFSSSDPLLTDVGVLPGYPESGYIRANSSMSGSRTGALQLLNGDIADDGVNPPRHVFRKCVLFGTAAVQTLHDLNNLPPGFQITAIQTLIGFPVPSNPQPTSIPPYYGTILGANYLGRWDGEPPVVGNPGDPGVWDSFTTNFGLDSIGGTFDPATDSLNFLVGQIDATFFQPAAVLAIDASPTSGLSITKTTSPIEVSGNPVLTPATGIPYAVARFSWVSDSDDCSGLTAPTGLTVTDSVTGAITWTIPGGATGTIVKVVSLTETTEEYVAGPTNDYIPTLSGDLTITIYAVSGAPVICTSSGVSVSVSVTAPLIFTMGEDGITTGIFLGGTSTLQFIGNPSGIYTVVPGKAYDTLYERIPAVTSQDVKIPDPFIITAYIGE